MNKKNGVKHLGKSTSQRNALVKSQVKDLLSRGYIKTTKARARAISQKVDSLLAFVEEKNDKKVREYLVDDKLSAKVMTLPTSGRKYGFTSVTSIKSRAGDRAELVLVELLAK
jgi:large subunit ribosomal protein L17